MAVELGKRFNLNDALKRGLLPLVISSSEFGDVLKTYVALYMREEVQMEGLVAQHLMAWNSYRGDKNKVYFWRTAAGSEIDFVVYGSEVFWAIEVKNTARIRPEDLRSLNSFRSDYPESTAYFLYRGKERLVKNGILCMPCEEFLQKLTPKKTEI